mgnify:CR=1 FL=1
MFQTLRQIKARIKSVESVKRMTWAMEMVSASKLRSIQAILAGARAYHAEMEALLGRLLASCGDIRHPFLEDRPGNDKSILFVSASDTGLCGGYNNSIVSKVMEYVGKRPEGSVSFAVLGKKAAGYFERRCMKVIRTYPEMYGRYSGVKAKEIAGDLVGMFTDGLPGEINAVYSSFTSVGRHEVVAEKILAVRPPAGAVEEIIIEPSAASVIERLLPAYVESKVKCVMLNAFASEHSARVISMGEATNNARDMLDGLILARNKTRQAGITREIIEVISASDALKG